uniref:Heme oxygenase n=1 Tax=Oncorhynchus kisutch TaxID=8019 RepID=A0A8C7GLL7_ONCKI
QSTLTSHRKDREDLSEQIKATTKEIHVRAENTQLMLSYQKGQITLPGFHIMNGLECLLFNLLHTLEEEMDRNASHPGVAPIYFPQELARLETLERDLEHFFGQGWQKRVIIPAATHRYTQRLRKIGEGNPKLLVAHAYTRYLGDLSAGQVLGKITQKSIGLSSGEGLSFFSFPGVSSPNRFKQLYRSRMNSIELTKEEREGVLEEAIMAFDLNIQVSEREEAGDQEKAETPAIIPSLSIMQLSLGICVALATVGMGIYVF